MFRELKSSWNKYTAFLSKLNEMIGEVYFSCQNLQFNAAIWYYCDIIKYNCKFKMYAE